MNDEMIDFCTLFEGTPDCYLVLDRNLKIVAVTNAYACATMTKRNDILGKGLFDIFPDNPDDPAAEGERNLHASLLQVLKTNTPDAMPVQKYDIRKPESEGGGFEARYWSPVNTPVKDLAGYTQYIIHKVQDVTEFVRLKQQGVEQNRLNEALRERAVRMETEIFSRSNEVAASSAKLKAANKELEQLYAKTLELDQLKSQFFANVSHELRTPLTLIIAPLEQLLRLPIGTSTTEATRRQLEMMLRNARILYRHVSDLLDAAKLEAGNVRIAYSRFNLSKLLRTTAAQFDSLASDRGLSFSIEAPDTLDIEADAGKIQRILINLLSNAFKFTSEGGFVTLRLHTQEQSALIEVEDSGPGVPENMRQVVFERFRQIEGTAQRRFGGTGLGLAIVKEFAELHSGSVRVDEADKGGALFIVTLPLTAPSGTEINDMDTVSDATIIQATADELHTLAQTHPLNQPDIASGNKPLVLVIEDNPEMNQFISETLNQNYQVISAYNGQEGIDLAQKFHPDLVICDVMMPIMSGDQVVAELRQKPEFADMPILMLTAKMDESFRVDMFTTGIQGYMNKPFAVDELFARVGNLVASRLRTLDELRRLNADLEHRVVERTTELTQANQELDTFAYAVSHDLRAPLRAMNGFTNALIEDYGNNLTGEAQSYLQEISNASHKMGALIDGMLKLSRTIRGEIRREPIDISAMAERLNTELTREEPMRSVTCKVEPGMVVVGDRHLMEAVLSNLLENAWKYTGKIAMPQIHVYSEQHDGRRWICIEDNGAGFDMGYADKLFKPFQRLHRQDEFLGIGIGLATVQRIIRRHGGEIRAQGELGNGAKFCFSLPNILEEVGQ